MSSNHACANKSNERRPGTGSRAQAPKPNMLVLLDALAATLAGLDFVTTPTSPGAPDESSPNSPGCGSDGTVPGSQMLELCAEVDREILLQSPANPGYASDWPSSDDEDVYAPEVAPLRIRGKAKKPATPPPTSSSGPAAQSTAIIVALGEEISYGFSFRFTGSLADDFLDLDDSDETYDGSASDAVVGKQASEHSTVPSQAAEAMTVKTATFADENDMFDGNGNQENA